MGNDTDVINITGARRNYRQYTRAHRRKNHGVWGRKAEDVDWAQIWRAYCPIKRLTWFSSQGKLLMYFVSQFPLHIGWVVSQVFFFFFNLWYKSLLDHQICFSPKLKIIFCSQVEVDIFLPTIRYGKVSWGNYFHYYYFVFSIEK